MRWVALGLGLLCAGAAPLSARPLEKELPVGAPVCYERVYDAAHLASHPAQEVTRIKLDHASDRDESGKEVVFASVEIMVRGKPEPYDLTGLCKASGSGLLCTPEWDAGTFRIEPGKDGALLITNNSMVFNPYGFDSEEVAPGAIRLKGDDKVWMVPTSARCDTGAARKGEVPNPTPK